MFSVLKSWDPMSKIVLSFVLSMQNTVLIFDH